MTPLNLETAISAYIGFLFALVILFLLPALVQLLFCGVDALKLAARLEILNARVRHNFPYLLPNRKRSVPVAVFDWFVLKTDSLRLKIRRHFERG